MTPPARESGYALLAAVASIAVFGVISLTALRATEGSIMAASAEVDRARMSAAADAGRALALQGLLASDRESRWSIDGRPRQLSFGGTQMTIRIEDEHGKVPINGLEDKQVEALFAGLGLSGERLKIVTDSLQDWIDDDEDTRPNGAEAAYYAPRGIRPRNGGLQSIGEAGLIRGFDPALVSRLAQVATVDFGHGSFDPRDASPLALQVMSINSDDDTDSATNNAVDVINRQREVAGQRVAIDLADNSSLIGRPLTIVVDADLPDHAHIERRTIVQITGSAKQPYFIRSVTG